MVHVPAPKKEGVLRRCWKGGREGGGIRRTRRERKQTKCCARLDRGLVGVNSNHSYLVTLRSVNGVAQQSIQSHLQILRDGH